ncbi:GNAT family N-acetyltransferase [Puia sp. P3]|uniref:GNAT family N-acetyltransferase n=1 Tax=Puia sp. P3 TaxID=3423952 RepID=UPI003D6786A0
MEINLQPVLENDIVLLAPLVEEDFENLYAVASDPKVWEQHPNKDRWQREVFTTLFRGAMESGGAFRIVDKKTGEVAGSTRLYDYDSVEKSIKIGYTFYATRYWGTGLNPMVKRLMLDYAFQFVDRVYLHVGATNLRSQIAVSRLGATKIGEETVAYYGEQPKLNFVYEIRKSGGL